MSDHRRIRPRRALRVLAIAAGLVVSLMLGLHLFAGPTGIPDGWRSTPPAPPPMATNGGGFELAVTPIEALIDEPIQIEVSGLAAREEVILRARTRDADDVLFSSWARFRADEKGRLDPSRSAPLEGTYSGVDGNGLLWSMGVEGDPPFYTARSWSRREVEISAETAGGVRRTTLRRLYPWNDLYFETVEDGVKAELWAPAEGTALPAVIKLGGFGDGVDPLGSALLAARGFLVLDLGYHARQGLPDDLIEIPVETVIRAVDWLQAQPRVDPQRIGLMGISKGAELALLAASMDPRIRAVAAWAPSSVAFVGISFRDPTPGSSWSLSGTPVAHAAAPLDLRSLRTAARLLLGRPVSFRPTYERALDLAIEAGRQEIFLPVERINGPILLAAGTDDLMWPADRMAEQIVGRLERFGFSHAVESLIEPGTGHRLSYALWPTGGGPSRRFIRGGTPETSHRSGQRVWQATLAMFRDSLAAAGEPDPPTG